MNPYPDNNPLIGELNNMPGGEPLPLIVQQITIRPPVRRKMEIVDWRVALRNAKLLCPAMYYSTISMPKSGWMHTLTASPKNVSWA